MACKTPAVFKDFYSDSRAPFRKEQHSTLFGRRGNRRRWRRKWI